MGTSKQRIGVLIVDDHRTFAEALRIAVDLERDLVVLGVADDGETAVRMAGEQEPDVVLMDVDMPGMGGIEATRRIREASPRSHVVILSGYEEELLRARAVEAGATGWLSKSGSVGEVPRAVRAAFAGEPLLPPDEVRRLLRHLRHRRSLDSSERERVERLTPRETQILQRMADGMPTTAIAADLGVATATLRTHVQNVLTKLRVHSKLEALALVIRHGKVTPSLP